MRDLVRAYGNASPIANPTWFIFFVIAQSQIHLCNMSAASHFSGWLQKQGGVSSGKAGVSALRVGFLLYTEESAARLNLPNGIAPPDFSL
jgi:hypothetical protein